MYLLIHKTKRLPSCQHFDLSFFFYTLLEYSKNLLHLMSLTYYIFKFSFQDLIRTLHNTGKNVYQGDKINKMLLEKPKFTKYSCFHFKVSFSKISLKRIKSNYQTILFGMFRDYLDNFSRFSEIKLHHLIFLNHFYFYLIIYFLIFLILLLNSYRNLPRRLLYHIFLNFYHF